MRLSTAGREVLRILQQVAGKDALDVSNTAQLRDICLAAARIFGWKDEPPQVNVGIGVRVEQTVTEEQRARLIALFAEQQARSAMLHNGGSSQSQLKADIENPVRIPGRPFIEVDASYLPAPQPEAYHEESGTGEGWGLDHPELS